MVVDTPFVVVVGPCVDALGAPVSVGDEVTIPTVGKLADGNVVAGSTIGQL